MIHRGCTRNGPTKTRWVRDVPRSCSGLTTTAKRDYGAESITSAVARISERQQWHKARSSKYLVCDGKMRGKKKGGYQYRIGMYVFGCAFGLSPSPPARVAFIKLSQVKPKKRNMKMFLFDTAKRPQQVRLLDVLRVRHTLLASLTAAIWICQ
jgi:hypothetical protein